MDARRIHFVLVSVLALAACSSAPDVRTNLGAGVNLANYRTYAFVQDPGTNRGGYSTMLTGYFEAAIGAQLDARGYVRAEDGTPDLLVNFNTNVRQQTDVRSTPRPAVGYYGYYGYRVGLYSGFEDVQTIHYKIGTVNIDIVDAARKMVVWDGVAEGQLTNEALKNQQAAVQRVVASIFKDFPGRAAAPRPQ